MLKPLTLTATVIALSLVAAGSAAKPAPKSKAKPKEVFPSRLLPLTEREMFSGPETGCQFAFSQGDDDFIFIIERRFTIKTEKGVHNCTITDEQFSGWGSGPVDVSCGGRSLSLKPTGPGKSYPEADSAEGPAALTMTQDGRSRTVQGKWSSAC